MIQQTLQDERRSRQEETDLDPRNVWFEYQRQATQLWGGIIDSWRLLLSGGSPASLTSPMPEPSLADLLPEPSLTSLLPMFDLNFTQSESDKETVLVAEIPGFVDGEVDAEIKDGRVAVKAEKHQSSEGSEFHLVYQQTADLPVRSDATEFQTTFHDGILKVHIPKADEKASRTTPAKSRAKASPKRSRGPRKTKQTRTRSKSTKRSTRSTTKSK